MGCGRTAGKPSLLRIALAGEGGSRRAVLDPENRLAGRGAYVCRASATNAPEAGCLAEALRRGGISRTLRARVPLDDKLVESVGR